MCVQTGKAHGADDWLGEAELLAARRQEPRAVTVLLRQAEVDEVEAMCVLGCEAAHQKVVGADVAVHVAVLVDELDGVEELVKQLKDGLERELTATPHHQVVERRAEQIDDHHLDRMWVIQCFHALL